MTDTPEGKDEHQDTGYLDTPKKKQEESQAAADVGESFQRNLEALENGALDASDDEDTEDISEEERAAAFLEGMASAGQPTIQHDMRGIEELGEITQKPGYAPTPRPSPDQLTKKPNYAKKKVLDQTVEDAGNTLLYDNRDLEKMAKKGDSSYSGIPRMIPKEFDIEKFKGIKCLENTFELEEILGKGGDGVVYLAWNRRLGQYVAIKFLQDLEDEDRFQREARAMATIKHPNVATTSWLFDFKARVEVPVEGEKPREEIWRKPFIVQDVLDHDLETRLGQEKSRFMKEEIEGTWNIVKHYVKQRASALKRFIYLPNRMPKDLKSTEFTVEYGVEMIRVLADGLHKVHQTRVIEKDEDDKEVDYERGLIHQDIKPLNIMFKHEYLRNPRKGKWDQRYLRAVEINEKPEEEKSQDKPRNSSSSQRLKRRISDVSYQLLSILKDQSEEEKSLWQKVKGAPRNVLNYLLRVKGIDKDTEKKLVKLNTVMDKKQQWEVRKVPFEDLKEGKVLLVDFGMAKEADMGLYDKARVLTEEEMGFMGTPNYASPEQAKGEAAKLNAKTDTWSLNMVLYNVLTKDLPLVGPSVVMTLLNLIDEVTVKNIEPPHKMNDNVDKELSAIIMKNLDYDPDKRQNAREFSDDLKNWLHNKPTSVSRWYSRPMKALQRSSKRLAIGLTLFAALATPLYFFANTYFEQKGKARDQVQLAIEDYKKFIGGTPQEYQDLIEQLKVATSADVSYLEGSHTTQFAQALNQLTKGKQQAAWKIKSDAMDKTIASVSTSYEAWIKSDSTDVATLGTLIEELDPVSSRKIEDFEEGDTQGRGYLRQAKRLTEELQDTKLKTERRSRISGIDSQTLNQYASIIELYNPIKDMDINQNSNLTDYMGTADIILENLRTLRNDLEELISIEANHEQGKIRLQDTREIYTAILSNRRLAFLLNQKNLEAQTILGQIEQWKQAGEFTDTQTKQTRPFTVKDEIDHRQRAFGLNNDPKQYEIIKNLTLQDKRLEQGRMRQAYVELNRITPLLFKAYFGRRLGDLTQRGLTRLLNSYKSQLMSVLDEPAGELQNVTLDPTERSEIITRFTANKREAQQESDKIYKDNAPLFDSQKQTVLYDRIIKAVNKKLISRQMSDNVYDTVTDNLEKYQKQFRGGRISSERYSKLLEQYADKYSPRSEE